MKPSRNVIDFAAAPTVTGSRYPAPFDAPCQPRRRKRLAQAAGLTSFGVNLLTLPPGAWSSQRHWHSHEDEFVWIITGELTLVSDAGEQTMRPGDFVAFKAGEADGHHLINRSGADAVLLEVGANDPERDRTVYSDIDMVAEPGEDFFRTKGAPYPLTMSEISRPLKHAPFDFDAGPRPPFNTRAGTLEALGAELEANIAAMRQTLRGALDYVQSRLDEIAATRSDVNAER